MPPENIPPSFVALIEGFLHSSPLCLHAVHTGVRIRVHECQPRVSRQAHSRPEAIEHEVRMHPHLTGAEGFFVVQFECPGHPPDGSSLPQLLRVLFESSQQMQCLWVASEPLGNRLQHTLRRPALGLFCLPLPQLFLAGEVVMRLQSPWNVSKVPDPGI